jgi:hypothetical protein
MECPICFETRVLITNDLCGHQVCHSCTIQVCICPICRKPWPDQLRLLMENKRVPRRVDDAIKLHLSRMITLDELIDECKDYQKNDTVNTFLIYCATLNPNKYELIDILRKKKKEDFGMLRFRTLR